MKQQVQAIIFDFFGVVVTDAWSALCSELAETDPDALTELRGLVHAANKGILDPKVSTAYAAKALGMSEAAYRARIEDGEAVDKQLLAYIKRLRGMYKTGLLSNITGSGLNRRFPEDELAQYFDVVVASSDIGYAKPEPEAYFAATERLGVDAEACIFLDDREAYCRAAEELGMQAIVYQSFPQAKRELEQLLPKEKQ